jgi:hypothetical protein
LKPGFDILSPPAESSTRFVLNLSPRCGHSGRQW